MGHKHIALTLALLTLIACSKKEENETTTQVSAVVPVRAALVTMGNVPERLEVTGHTEALTKEKIIAPIAGRILSLVGTDGMFVEAGQVLAVIQSKEAEASEAGAKVMLAQARTPEERTRAERMVALAKLDQNGVEVKSQHSGLVASRSSNSGEFVSENQELLSIIGSGNIVFVADVPLVKMTHVRIGEEAKVILPTIRGDGYPVTVFAIKPQADSSSQTAKVVFQFSKSSPALDRVLRTGMAGTAEIMFNILHNAMLVPKTAVLRNDETNEHTVMTFGSDSIAHGVIVDVGPAMDGMVAIKSEGLKPGMNIIVEGGYALADSTRITLLRDSITPSGTP